MNAKNGTTVDILINTSPQYNNSSSSSSSSDVLCRFGEEIIGTVQVISPTHFYCNASLERLLLLTGYDDDTTATAFKYGHVKSFLVTASSNGGVNWGDVGSYFHILSQPRDPELAIIVPSTGPPSGGTTVSIVLPLALGSDEIAEIRSLLSHRDAAWCSFETIDTVPAIVATMNSMVLLCTSPPSSFGEITVNLSVTIAKSGQWMEQQPNEEEESSPNSTTENNNNSRIVIAMGTFTYSESFNPAYEIVNMFPNFRPYSGGTDVTFDVIIPGEEEDSSEQQPPSSFCCFGSTLVRARYDISRGTVTFVAPMLPTGQQTSSVPVSVVDGTSISWNEAVFCHVASPPVAGWFNYVPNVELHDISPKKGPTIGGTNIMLIGSGFESHVGTLECKFLRVNGSVTTTTTAIVESDTRASCASPAITFSPSSIDGGSGISSCVKLLSEAGTNFGVGLQLYQYIDIFPSHVELQLDSAINDDIILELSPSLGPETGGTIVTITSSSGMYADASTACKFAGYLSLTPPQHVSANSITCITPPHPPGTVDVRISVDGQQYTKQYGLFTYYAMPVASVVSPSHRPNTGGTTVVITGNRYINSGAIMVSFGDKTVYGKFLNESAIEATTPSVSIDGVSTMPYNSTDNTDEQFTTVLVSISLNGGAGKLQRDNTFFSTSLKAVGAASFQYSHFNFETFSWKLSPSSGPMEGGTVVSIYLPSDVESRYIITEFSVSLMDTYGDGVFGLNGGGDGEHKSSHVIVTTIPENRLNFVVPMAVMQGMVDVELLYRGTQVTSFTHQFLYYSSEGQGITVISPTFGPDNGGTVVTVLGSGFTSLGPFSAPTCIFSVDSEAADSDHVTRVSASISSQDIITLTTPALVAIPSLASLSPGPVSLQISLNGRDSVPGTLEFTYVSASTVLSVWPSTGSIKGGTRTIVRGTMFLSNIPVARGVAAPSSSSPTLWCRFGDQLVMADEVVDSTTVVCTTPQITTTQVVEVSVGYNPLDFSAELQQGFTYHDEISITGLFPAIGPVEGGTAVRISCKGFDAATRNGKPFAVTCRFGNEIVVEATTVESSSTSEQHVVCVSPSWVSRLPQKVVVGVSLNGIDFILSPQLFEYFHMPVVTKAVPCIGPEMGGTEVVLSGTGFVSSVPLMCVFLHDETTSSLLLPPITTPAEYLSPNFIVCISPPGQPNGKVVIKVGLVENQHAWGPGGVTFLYHPALLLTAIEPAFGGGSEMVTVSTTSDIRKIFDDLAAGGDEYGDVVVDSSSSSTTGNMTCGFSGLPEGFVSVPSGWLDGMHVACVTPSRGALTGAAAELLPNVVRVSISLNGMDFSESFVNFTYARNSSGLVSALALSPSATPKEGGGQLILSFSDALFLPPVSEILICRVSIHGIVSQRGEIPLHLTAPTSNIQWEIESRALRTTTPSLISCEVPPIPPLWEEIINSVLFGESSSSRSGGGHYVDVEIISGSSHLPIAPSSR